MASIKGCSLKAVKGFKGHDGEPLQQGKICLDGKVVGEFSEDAWGGCMQIRGCNVSEDEMFKLLELTNLEKMFKKGQKKSPLARVIDVETLMDERNFKAGVTYTGFSEEHEVEIANQYPNRVIKVYRKLEDFIL